MIAPHRCKSTLTPYRRCNTMTTRVQHNTTCDNTKLINTEYARKFQNPCIIYALTYNKHFKKQHCTRISIKRSHKQIPTPRDDICHGYFPRLNWGLMVDICDTWLVAPCALQLRIAPVSHLARWGVWNLLLFFILYFIFCLSYLGK